MKRIYRPELNRLMDEWRSGGLTRSDRRFSRGYRREIYGISETSLDLGQPVKVTGSIYSSEREFLSDYLEGRMILYIRPYALSDANPLSEVTPFGPNRWYSIPDALTKEPLSAGEPGLIQSDIYPLRIADGHGESDFLFYTSGIYYRMDTQTRTQWKSVVSICRTSWQVPSNRTFTGELSLVIPQRYPYSTRPYT